MKSRLQLLLAAVVIIALAPAIAETASAASPDCGPTVRKSNGTAWKCTFTDEFGGSTLNRNKWVVQRTAVSGHSGNKADCWVDHPNNISVANGTLRLTSRKESVPFVCNHPNRRYTTQYSSGSVSTWGKFQQTYGRWQIRAKFPDITETGSQSALWLYPKDQAYGAWPRSGEIDIAEFYTRLPDRVYPVIHYRARGRANRTLTSKTCMVKDPSSFHTYTAEWTKTTIKIWADSTLCVSHTIRPGGRLAAPAPFDQPFVTYLTQSLGVGQNRFRDIGRNKTPLPARTEIDWVRVWS